MAETTEGAPGAEQEPPKGDEQQLGDAGRRALDAERRARKAAEKRASEAEAKVQEAEDAEKTEVERLKGQLTALTSERDAAVSRADRFEIAADKGLSLAQARRLVGSTKEELEADADEMRAELGLDKKKDDQPKGDEEKGGRGLPTEDLKPGASNAEDEEPDYKAIADAAATSGW